MWVQHVGPVLTGVAGLVTAIVGIFFTARPRRISGQLVECQEELNQCEQESEVYRQQVLIALRHIFRLEKTLAQHGYKPPARPEGLDL